MILALRRNAPPLLGLLVGLALFSCPASAAYRLGPGDTLDISVFGSADFKRRVVVDVDGQVSLPFLGSIRAAGLQVDDLRKTVEESLRENAVMARPDVTVDIAEYRPFFISGDVAKPGAIPFRPGLTVRIAVALAGGFDALRFKSDNPLLSGPGYRSDYDSLWVELIRQQAKALTLRAELDNAQVVDLSVLTKAPLPREVVERVSTLEQRDFGIRRAATQRDLDFIKASLKRVESDVAVQRKTLANQAEAIATQLEAGARLRDAQARGLVSGVRTAEDSRDLSSLRSAQDQSSHHLSELLNSHADWAKRLDAFDDERRAKIIHDLQEVTVGAEKTGAQIRAASERLIYTGALKAQLRQGPGPDIIIHRREGDKDRAIEANEDASVLPDDVVDVVIRPDQQLLGPTQ